MEWALWPVGTFSTGASGVRGGRGCCILFKKTTAAVFFSLPTTPQRLLPTCTMEPARLETGPDRKRRRVVDEAVPAAVAADVVHVDPAPTPTPTPTPPDPDPASAAEPRWVQFQ